ncbi:unnamed protein product [Prunus armeniaca]
MANLHYVMDEGQFQRWQAAYASAIPDDVHIKLAKPLTDVVPCVDANDPNAKIMTFRPFYFSLGFKFPMSKLFKEVFCSLGCAPSQCTPNVYRAACNVYRVDDAQVRIYKVKLFDSLSQGDHAWHDAVLEVSGRWEGDVGDGPLVPITYCDGIERHQQQLELGPDMAKVRRPLNIPRKFREWCWLLSEYQEEDGGLPPAEDVKRWKQNGPNPDALSVEQEECSAEPP